MELESLVKMITVFLGSRQSMQTMRRAHVPLPLHSIQGETAASSDTSCLVSKIVPSKGGPTAVSINDDLNTGRQGSCFV